MALFIQGFICLEHLEAGKHETQTSFTFARSHNNPNGNGVAWTSAEIECACHGLLAVLLGDFLGHAMGM